MGRVALRKVLGGDRRGAADQLVKNHAQARSLGADRENASGRATLTRRWNSSNVQAKTGWADFVGAGNCPCRALTSPKGTDRGASKRQDLRVRKPCLCWRLAESLFDAVDRGLLRRADTSESEETAGRVGYFSDLRRHFLFQSCAMRLAEGRDQGFGVIAPGIE